MTTLLDELEGEIFIKKKFRHRHKICTDSIKGVGHAIVTENEIKKKTPFLLSYYCIFSAEAHTTF